MDRDEIEKYFRGIADASVALNKGAASVARVFEEKYREVQSVVKSHEEQIRKAANSAERFLISFQEAAKGVAPFLVKLHQAIEQLPQRTKDELEALATHGWYIDPDMPCSASTELAALFLDGKSGEGDLLLEQYFDENAGSIETRLLGVFPSREPILSEAFDAHRRGMYALSVPVFLAQADGVCKERLGVQLYGKTKGGDSTQVRDAIDELELDPFLESLLAPFLKPFAINAGPNQRTDAQLNRHAVLHGESVVYGTFRNSCKAMSLISFTEWALSERFGAER